MTWHPLDANMIAADAHYERADDEPNYDCPCCQGGDRWPVSEPHWRCAVCDTEYFDTDHEEGSP